MSSVRPVVAAFGLVVLGACGDAPKQVTNPPACEVSPVAGIAPALVPATSPFDSVFAAAAAEFGVPAAVLRAIGYVETRWQMVEGSEEFAGMPPAHGLMALRGERLREGARLIGRSEQVVRRDAEANVRAAAALLRADADAMNVDGSDPARWAPVIARYAGLTGAAAEESYVRDVHSVIDGRRSMPSAVAASPLDACVPPPPPPPVPVADQAGATWRASPNFNQRMAGDPGRIHIVIIHSCEGSYVGCWSWLANVESQVSAHYVVREDGAEITQLVREASRAWHIGAIYDSTLNAGHDGRLHGVQSNHFTIGVEHAGYASQVAWPTAQIDASARLVCDVAKRWDIPRDRLHIVSHGQLQPWNRTDPGQGWPWADYLERIDRYCA